MTAAGDIAGLRHAAVPDLGGFRCSKRGAISGRRSNTTVGDALQVTEPDVDIEIVVESLPEGTRAIVGELEDSG